MSAKIVNGEAIRELLCFNGRLCIALEKKGRRLCYKDLTFEVSIYDEDEEGNTLEPRGLTQEEMDTVVIEAPYIELKGFGTEIVVRHDAPEGKGFFTIGALAKAIEETERKTRPHTKWARGMDAHHVLLEQVLPVGAFLFECDFGS